MTRWCRAGADPVAARPWGFNSPLPQTLFSWNVAANMSLRLKSPRLIRFLLTTFRGFLGHLDESA